MGKLKTELFKYLSPEHFRTLTAVEMGMKNHEVVAVELIIAISNLKQSAGMKLIKDLVKHRLLAYEHQGRSGAEGYRLTFSGYDYLALKVLVKRGSIESFGTQLGVGKESDVYTVTDADGRMRALKIHRLGRTSFRKLKEKRDYHKHRTNMSWLYLSRLAATKEFAFMKALYGRKFPVPEPLDSNRHCVLMELVDGYPMAQVRSVANPDVLYNKLMQLVVRLAEHGVIHCDLNEFNLLVSDAEEPILIDFPQMVSIAHPNAEVYFDRDVQGILDLFRRRFGYESGECPKLADVKKEFDMDNEVEASGFTKSMEKVLVAERDDADDENEKDENAAGSGSDDDHAHDSKQAENSSDKEESDSSTPCASDAEVETDDEKDIVQQISRVDISESAERTPDLLQPVVSRHRDIDSMSTASTIAPEVIRNRVKQALKQRDKQARKLRVKSQMSKITNSRRDTKNNMQIAREFADE